MPEGTAHQRGTPTRLRRASLLQFEEGETPSERLRGGETELKVWCVEAGHLYMRVRRKLNEERQRLKVASITGLKHKP